MTSRKHLINQLLEHSPAMVEANNGGWASDRLQAINEIEWDLIEAGVEIKSFKWASYRARLARHGRADILPLRN